MEEQPYTQMPDVPAEVWAHVASFLPPKELASGGLALSCHSLRDLCSLDVLWHNAFRQRWPLRGGSTQPRDQCGQAGEEGWKGHFARMMGTSRAWREGRFVRDVIKVDMSVERLQLVGSEVFCTSNSEAISCFDINTRQLARKYVAPNRNSQHYLGFYCNAKTGTLVTVDYNVHMAILFDRATGKVKAEQQLERGPTTWAVQSDEQKAVMGAGNFVRVWDLPGDTLLAPPESGHSDQIRSLKYVGNILFTGGALGDNTAKMWDFRDMRNPIEEIKIDNGVWCMDYDGEKLAFGTLDDIHMYDVRVIPKPLACQRKAHGGHINMTQFDDRKLVSAGNDRCVKVWSVDSLEPWYTLGAEQAHHAGMIRMGMFEDEVLVYGGTHDSRVLHVHRFGLDADVNAQPATSTDTSPKTRPDPGLLFA